MEAAPLEEETVIVAEAVGPIEPKPRDGGAAEPAPAALTGGRGKPALAATETEELCEEEPAGDKTAVEGRGGKP